MNNKWVLILGGCCERGQIAAKKCIDQDYTVVVVDKKGKDDLPENWPSHTNCNDNKNFVYYEDDVLNFLTTETFFQHVNWSIVMNFAHIKHEDYIEEVTYNNILEAYFVRWVHALPYPKPEVITCCEYSLVGQHFATCKQLWA